MTDFPASPPCVRERRFSRKIRDAEAEIYREVKDLMASGMTFEEAWIANGGMIIPALSAFAWPERDTP